MAISKTRVTGTDGHSGEANSLQSTVFKLFTDRLYVNAREFASSDVETDGVGSFGYILGMMNSLSFFVGRAWL